MPDIQIGILGGTGSWHVQDLLRAASHHEGIRCWVGSLSQLSARASDAGTQWTIGCGGTFRDVTAADALIVRSMPKGTLEQIIWRMDVLSELSSAGTVVVNPPRSLETAIDKYLTLERLRSAGVPFPATEVCQSAEMAVEAFDRLGGDVVVKPLFGSEGRGLHRVRSRAAMAQLASELQAESGILYVQQFIEHPGFDLRIMVVGTELIGMRRNCDGDWRANVCQGAKPVALEIDDELRSLARRAALAVDVPIAGVDILPDIHGRRVVLEVNAVPGWRALSQVTRIDIAALVLQYVQQMVVDHQGN